MAVLSVTALGAASAQIPDVPSLDFNISPSQGEVGSTVEGEVDANDVAELCITDPEEFASSIVRFHEEEYGPYFEQLLVEEGRTDLDISNSADFVRFMVGAAVTFGIAQDPSLAGGALDSTFVMAFADLATTSPIDPIGSFDPNLGEGSVDVPDIEPGIHPVIATCVEIPEGIGNDVLASAEAVATAYLEANYDQPYPVDIGVPDGEFETLASEILPILLREVVEPKALGIQFFCVDDGTGSCDEEETPDPTDPETPPGEGGEGEGDGGNGGSQAPGATPVKGRPSYTG